MPADMMLYSSHVPQEHLPTESKSQACLRSCRDPLTRSGAFEIRPPFSALCNWKPDKPTKGHPNASTAKMSSLAPELFATQQLGHVPVKSLSGWTMLGWTLRGTQPVSPSGQTLTSTQHEMPNFLLTMPDNSQTHFGIMSLDSRSGVAALAVLD